MKTILNSLELALQNIRSNFFRTILSILGIVIGVASLVGILSLIDGMELFAREQISQTTSLNAINIHTETHSTVNNVRVRKDTFATLTISDVHALQRAISQPVDCYARVSKSGLVKIDSATNPVGVTAIASMPNLEPDIVFEVGKSFDEAVNYKGVIPAIVNADFAKAVYGESAKAVGKKFRLIDKSFQIVGVIKREKANKSGAPRFFYPLASLSVQEWRSDPPEIYVFAKNTEQVPEISKTIKAWLSTTYPKNKEDFSVLTNEFRVEQAAKGFLLFRVIMGLIVGISVLVGGIGVMNVLIISVTERTREIGIRKAMGANKRHILLQFLSESIAISSVGSFIGFVLGVLGTMAVVPIVKAITKIPFQAAYTWNTFFVIAIIAIAVGIIFGTYPALRAAKLDPVEAIRHE